MGLIFCQPRSSACVPMCCEEEQAGSLLLSAAAEGCIGDVPPVLVCGWWENTPKHQVMLTVVIAVGLCSVSCGLNATQF